MAALSAVLEVHNANGERVDLALRQPGGGYLPVNLVIGAGLSATAARNGPVVEVTIDADAGAGVTAVTADAPLAVANGTSTPHLTIANAAHDQRGTMSGADFDALSTLASLPRPIPGSATTGSAIPVTGAGAASDSSGRVALGFDDPHNLAPGDRIYVHGVLPEAEGAFTVEIDDAYTVWLVGTTFVGTWSGSGVVYRCADLVAIPAPNDASTVALFSVTAKSATGSYRRTHYLGIEVASGVATPVLTQLATTHDGLALDSVAVVSIANSTGEIEITTHRPHGASTGDTLLVSGVGSGADGTWTVTRISSTKAKLNGSTYVGAGTTGSAVLGWRSAIAGEWAADVFMVYAIGSGDAESITWSAQAFGVV